MKPVLVALRVFFAFTAWLIFKRRETYAKACTLLSENHMGNGFPLDVRLQAIVLHLQDQKIDELWARYDKKGKET